MEKLGRLLLDKFATLFLEDVDKTQLKLAWNGAAELTNIVIKTSILDDLNLPVQVVHGSIGRLALKIPWHSIYTSPTTVLIEDIYLVVAPNQQVAYDPVRAEKEMFAAKQKELKRIEEAERSESEKEKPLQDPNLAQRFLFAMIRNIQLTIKNVHIRYEDKVTYPDSPFSFGFTLSNLHVESTDANWKVTFIDTKDLKEPLSRFYKIAQLESLSAYWNNPSELCGHLPMNEMHEVLANIAHGSERPANYTYILGPMNILSRMRVNLNPERDDPPFTYPKFHLNIEIDTLYLGFTKNQYRCLMALTDSMDRMTKGAPYRKYRPNCVSYTGNYKEWWRFAYTCILEEQVRRKKREWSWQHIHDYRNTCTEYKELYLKSKLSKELSAQDKQKLEECEKMLNVINIVVLRRHAELEAKRVQEEEKEKSFLGRWWGWRSDASTTNKAKTAIIKEFEAAMTPEEKEKLYRAVGFQDDHRSLVQYPENYISVSCALLLKSFEIEMIDEELEQQTVLLTTLKCVKCKVEMIPLNSGLRVSVQLDDLTTVGMKDKDDYLPEIITTLADKQQKKALLEVFYEKNPIDRKCDQRIQITSQPIKITYNSATINTLVDVFKVPKDTSLDQIQIVAESRLSQVKQMTSTGLQYAIDKHIYVDVNIDLQAPYIVIPYGGKYTGSENVLVANLGHLKIYSSGERNHSALDIRTLYEQGLNQQEILSHMVSHAYDNFTLEFKDLQILMSQGDENWETVVSESLSSEMHLLHPLSLTLVYSKCMIPDDPRLPLNKISGQLPSVDVKLSEARLLLLTSLIFSINFPSGDESTTHTMTTLHKASSLALAKYKEFQDKTKETQRLLTKITQVPEREVAQLTSLEASFVMEELSLTINRQENINSTVSELAAFKLSSLECTLTQRTYDLAVGLHLGSIILKQTRDDTVVNIIDTPVPSQKDEYLFIVKYVQVDPKSPELHTTHQSCESYLSLNFGSLNVILHQESLLALLEFSTLMQDNVNELRTEHKKDRTATIKRTMSVISEQFGNVQKAMGIKQPRKKRSAKIEEVTKFKLTADLHELSVRMSTDKFSIASCSVRGINTTVQLNTTYTQVNARLNEVVVVDLDPITVHPLILCGTENIGLTAQIILYNTEEYSHDTDMEVNIKMSGFRLVFLNRFLMNCLSFLNRFQAAQQAIIEASQAAAESARENMKDVYSKSTKIILNIDVKAPDIVVPVDSKSYDALLVDLGTIILLNEFTTLEVRNDEGHYVIVDNLQVSLADLKIARVRVNNKNEIDSQYELLEPVTFILDIKRNLAAWYKCIPDLTVSGKLDVIQLQLGHSEYGMIMDILSGNLAEHKLEETLEAHSTTSTAKKLAVVEVEPDSAVQSAKSELTGRPTEAIRFSFTMNRLIIDLFVADAKNVEPSSGLPDTHLARFSLEGLSVKGRIMTDQSLVMSVLLVNCLLDDMRKSREDKLNRLVERSDVRQRSLSADDLTRVKSMIDVTYQQKADEMFADIRIYSFTVIISVEYIMKIAEFFKVPEASKRPTLQSASSQATSASAHTIKSATKFVTVPEERPAEAVKQMTINLKLEQPDIVLVEHMDNVNTQAMILNGELLVKLRLAGQHQVINGQMSDLQLYTCVYNPVLRSATRNNVLHPVTISVAGSTPEDEGLHIELLVTDVHLSVSPSTIELLNRVLMTLTKDTVTQQTEENDDTNRENLWQQKYFDDPDYWFLKTEYATDALDLMSVASRKSTQTRKVLQEVCIVSVPAIIVTVEVGIGNKTLPMLMLDTGMKASVTNWSSQLSVEASLTMQMGYYNSRLAIWEPLIEPLEGSKPWELKLEVSMNSQEQEESFSNTTPTDSEPESQLLQPLMDIDFMSEENLELTITKTLLEVLQTLGKSFAEAVQTESVKGSSSTALAPYKVVNDIGEDITLLLEKSAFTVIDGEDVKSISKSLEIPLIVKKEFAEKKTLDLGKELTRNAGKKNKFLHVKVTNKNCELALPVLRADKRYFLLNYRSSGSDNWGIVSDIKVDDGVTIITIRSILQVINHFNTAIDVYYMTPKGNVLELIGVVQPNSHLNVPLKAVYNPTNELFFGVSGYTVTNSPYVWKDLQTYLTSTKILTCKKKDGEAEEEIFVIKAVGEMEQIYFENTSRFTMSSACYNIHLRPAVIFKNCLPLDIVCCVDEKAEEFPVNAGDILQLPNVTPGNNVVVIRLPNYLEKEWSCREEIVEKPSEFAVWSFTSYDSPTKMTMDLGMHTLDKDGSLIMSLYCPFWMLNKTDLMLAYRSTEESMNILHHPPQFKGPILFSFSARNFFGKKKASVKVEGGEWSEKFSLDTAGSSGVVTCRTDDSTYQIGINNQLTYNNLTKQVTFTPFYVIINNATFSIECQESDRPADAWTEVKPKSCSALWPKSEKDDKLLRLRIQGTDEISAPFLYTESHNTLLRLDNNYGGVNVDIQITEGSVYINLAAYEVGSAPALIVNHTSGNICYWEKESVQKRYLQPKHSVLYTWENPSGPRILVWDRGYKKEILNDLRKDGGGEFSPSDEVNICWASFLDGMQRVLLFTENRSIATGAQMTNILEVIQREITLSIKGVGISFVNNITRQEIMYVGIASSGVIWETCKTNRTRYKQLNPLQSYQIETAYQQYLLITQQDDECTDVGVVNVGGKIEVDFKAGLMIKPHKRKLRRSYQTGLWFQLKSSPSQMQLHAKVNKLQIDNQMYDCIFPVVFAPVPPPRTVAADSGMRPFIEVSIVQLLLKNSMIKQYKYFKILVQEFHVKVDLGFVNALLTLFQQSDISVLEERELFLKDMQLVEEPLYSHASSKSIEQQKSFFDLLHFSPFKIHLSFSMAASSSGQNANAPTFLNILLQGVGVTLTDLQDVVFKLAYFERNYTFLTRNQLISEATGHYVGQFVKQLYVLVLGLDLIGNPYGLVLGITKGVEDLFYEPFQGAIQGPGEFAEGLALGVRSLFGHTVGGTAGAFSKITGAMGKGIAALTFDEDFQRKRRKALNKHGTVQEGLARSGKGLVMGVYSGLTGVFTKPVAGAKEEGVEGFFKGLGKGAVGLVTRPVAGVVDFASGSLDAVKRATEGGEEAKRLRPPRFLHADGMIRPYDRSEAKGNKLLMDMAKGKYAATDVYVTHYEVIHKKEIVILTDKRLAYIVHNDMFGGWQVEWSYTWEEMQEPAKVVPKGVLVSTSKEKRKLFGSNGTTKLILISNPERKEDLCMKIESLRRVSH